MIFCPVKNSTHTDIIRKVLSTMSTRHITIGIENLIDEKISAAIDENMIPVWNLLYVNIFREN